MPSDVIWYEMIDFIVSLGKLVLDSSADPFNCSHNGRETSYCFCQENLFNTTGVLKLNLNDAFYQ